LVPLGSLGSFQLQQSSKINLFEPGLIDRGQAAVLIVQRPVMPFANTKFRFASSLVRSPVMMIIRLLILFGAFQCGFAVKCLAK
jgi:hypothetical protein